MSADNTIVVVAVDGVFRVFHCQAVENMTDPDPQWARSFYDHHIRNAPRFSTKEKAMAHAQKLHDEYGYVEYGISFFGEFANPYGEPVEPEPKPSPVPVEVEADDTKYPSIYKATILSVLTRRTVVEVKAYNLTEALNFAGCKANGLWRDIAWETVQEHQEVMGIEFHETLMDEKKGSKDDNV